ncbi:MAG: AMP-binding protein [Desulfobulbaceae bacterium]|nr:AMP-binding protein [Desulfobulbaceae bacterium]
MKSESPLSPDNSPSIDDSLLRNGNYAETTQLPAVQHSFSTLNELIDHSVQQYGGYPVIGMAFEEPLTYRQFSYRIYCLARHMRAQGLKKGSRVALLAENSHNWGTAYLAAVRIGAVAVPILPDLPENDVRHIIGEMKCDYVFITQQQIEKIYELKKKIKKIITLDDYYEKNGVVATEPFSRFLLDAEEHCKENEPTPYPEVNKDDLASILYTSGTSGFSKAVMLTHGNLCANAMSASKLIAINPGKTFLSVLPISHTYEFTVGFLLPLIKGCRIVYAGKSPTPTVLHKICSAEKPSAMLVVPLIMEKIFKKRVLPAIEKSKVLSYICRFNFGRKLIYRKIGKKLLQFFGNNLEVMGIGGAAINPDVEIFLRDAGFPYLVGYGQTESSPLISGGPQGDTTITIGSSGKPVPGVDVRISNPNPETGIGEIQARGDNVMKGYWNDEEATREALIEDGWLRTGDMGLLDEIGNLHILGRSKSIIVLASGENIYPEAIEHKLNSYPFVVESLVVENNGMLEAWIYPDYEFIDMETTGQSRQQRHKYIMEHLDRMRSEVNKQLPTTSRLSRVIERREPFIKTATHKIKRYLYSDRHMAD